MVALIRIERFFTFAVAHVILIQPLAIGFAVTNGLVLNEAVQL
eukprot:SAG31_NODE_34895_length_328_cov_0.772926_1_plen_42_part_10